MCDCLQCRAVQGSAVQCSAGQGFAGQRRAVQCSAVQCTRFSLSSSSSSLSPAWANIGTWSVQYRAISYRHTGAVQNMSEQFSNVQNRTTNVEQMSADPVQICGSRVFTLRWLIVISTMVKTRPMILKNGSLQYV